MATTAGYQTIGGDASTAPKQPSTDAGSIVQEKLGAVARGAGEAATGAREAVAELITAPMPEVNIYTEPLQPAAQLNLRDRVALVLQSCRDWGEFADVRQFNLPHPSEAKLRFGYNLETFFYNYIVIAFAYFVIKGLFNIGAALQIVLLLAIATYFYALHPDNFVFANGNVVIDTNIKHGIMITLTALVVVFGKSVFGFVLGGAIFMAFIVGLHALLRKHPVPTSEI